jgi:hypothetical protein
MKTQAVFEVAFLHRTLNGWKWQVYYTKQRRAGIPAWEDETAFLVSKHEFGDGANGFLYCARTGGAI